MFVQLPVGVADEGRDGALRLVTLKASPAFLNNYSHSLVSSPASEVQPRQSRPLNSHHYHTK